MLCFLTSLVCLLPCSSSYSNCVTAITRFGSEGNVHFLEKPVLLWMSITCCKVKSVTIRLFESWLCFLLFCLALALQIVIFDGICANNLFSKWLSNLHDNVVNLSNIWQNNWNQFSAEHKYVGLTIIRYLWSKITVYYLLQTDLWMEN